LFPATIKKVNGTSKGKDDKAFFDIGEVGSIPLPHTQRENS
jgi:hypothetical protein